MPTRSTFERFEVGGVGITAWTFEEAVRTLLSLPEPGAARALDVHFVTAHTIVEATDNDALREELRAADLVSPDGMPLVWTGRLKGYHVGRVYGPDMMLALADRGRSLGRRHYFYGGADGVPELLAHRLSERFPGMVVAGTYSPPFRELTAEESTRVVARINSTRPDYVWVGLGSPKQDRWVHAYRDRLSARALLAVGAAFDFHSGLVPEAPRWMRQSGLQWLHRLFQEPSRLWRRYTHYNARFVVIVLPALVSDLIWRLRHGRHRIPPH